MHRPVIREDLMRPVKDQVKRLLAKRGVHLVRSDQSDMEPGFWTTYERCHLATMTSVERMYALHQAIGHIETAGVPGAVVECGVWRGGSSMLAALTLAERGEPSRELWLYDTYEGMSEPTPEDVQAANGRSARREWQASEQDDHNAWCYASLDEVRDNLRSTGYPDALVHFVKGKVEDTIPAQMPERIALLRLDTDWYESTRHELEHLYPRLVPGGALIVDDYGFWAGARRAVDEYFAASAAPLLLNRIDDTGRVGIRTA